MSRDISPPPTKRRKTIARASTPVGTQTAREPEPLPPLDANKIRIFSWNINGITPFLQKPITSFFRSTSSKTTNDGVPPASLRHLLHRHNWPSILFLQEVKIAPIETKIQQGVGAAINSRLAQESNVEDDGPTYEAHFTLPADPHNARGLGGKGKVYGVCSILRTDLRDKYSISVRSVDWDAEGRISIVELITKSQPHSNKLAIFNIYAVNGTGYAYRDPTTGAVKGTRHDRKRELHSLLRDECKKLENKGWNVLLGGDMNVAPDARDGYPNLRVFPCEHAYNRLDFQNKILGSTVNGSGLNGVDVWRAMHGEERRYTYYPRSKKWGSSCDRVDYFVAGRKAWEKGMVKNSGIMNTQAERGPSDHCPIWVDIELQSKDEAEEDAK